MNYTHEQIMAMTIDELNRVTSEIRSGMTSETADLNQMTQVLDWVEERRNAIRNQAEQRRALAARIAGGQTGTEARSLGNLDNAQEQRTYDASSAEYRRAWLKMMSTRDGVSMFGDMTNEERTAFTVTTTNTGAVVPTVLLNRIVELVQSMSPMLNDATVSSMTSGFGVPRHTGVAAGDATGVAEGAANADDEHDNFDLLSLDGIELKKHVVITRKMKFQSIDAFESWLAEHLAKRIAVAKEKTIIARLDGTAPAGGSVRANAGIAAANILTAQTYTDATLRALIAKIDATGEVIIYANRKTIWEHLYGIADANGRPLYVANSMSNPENDGRILGCAVKPDNNLADHVVYFVAKGQVLANNFDEMEIFSAVEPKTANTIETAYALFDAGLENPKGAVKATFTVSA